jgi:hypothetical protein
LIRSVKWGVLDGHPAHRLLKTLNVSLLGRSGAELLARGSMASPPRPVRGVTRGRVGVSPVSAVSRPGARRALTHPLSTTRISENKIARRRNRSGESAATYRLFGIEAEIKKAGGLN